jgi:predicted DNA-binding transcriptional regulator AlpA
MRPPSRRQVHVTGSPLGVTGHQKAGRSAPGHLRNFTGRTYRWRVNGAEDSSSRCFIVKWTRLPFVARPRMVVRMQQRICNFDQSGSSVSPISVRVPQAVAMTGFSRSRLYDLIRSSEIASTMPSTVLGSLVLLWLSGIGEEPYYFTHVVPAIFGLAFGFAMGIVALRLSAVRGVRAQETGVASALLNAS